MVKFLFIISISIILFCVILSIIAKPFQNPYKLIMVFGKKGSGKSTFITKTALQYIKKGITVYSTIYVPGARVFNVDDIGKCQFEPDSIKIIESGSN